MKASEKQSETSALSDQHDFTIALTQEQIVNLQRQLTSFVAIQQQTIIRPICLVSSGGTAVDLEVNAVRCLDNFSTGLRGAISVEEFLKRGYAVIHLQREGSASPFARVLSNQLGLKQSNYGLSSDCLGKLFADPGAFEDEDDDLIQSVLKREKDPWMTNPEQTAQVANTSFIDGNDVTLHRAVSNSAILRKMLNERSDAVRQNRLITIPFRTVEEYLAKLQICAENLSSVQSLSMFFLAAAVSDFYIPMNEKSVHKIQSGSHEEGFMLHLQPVPKALNILRYHWAPNSFVVSFKLETDVAILRQKSMRAVEKYGCHMVIGNVLQSRHEKVWILAPESYQDQPPLNLSNWSMTEVSKDPAANMDALESSIVDMVVQSHFEFISYHYTTAGMDFGNISSAKENYKIEKKKQERKIFWNKVKNVGIEVLGAVLTLWISYRVNAAFHRRYQSLLTES